MQDGTTGIGRRIYDLRIERDVQQRELAQAINIHQSVLNRIERGTRAARDREIRAIALYFGVSSDSLLALPQPPERESEYAMSPTEIAMLEKYRMLDERGRNAVNYTLSNESLLMN